jgi:hypothetical protein
LKRRGGIELDASVEEGQPEVIIFQGNEILLGPVDEWQKNWGSARNELGEISSFLAKPSKLLILF